MKVVLVGRWGLIMVVLNDLNMGSRFIRSLMDMVFKFTFRDLQELVRAVVEMEVVAEVVVRMSVKVF